MCDIRLQKPRYIFACFLHFKQTKRGITCIPCVYIMVSDKKNNFEFYYTIGMRYLFKNHINECHLRNRISIFNRNESSFPAVCAFRVHYPGLTILTRTISEQIYSIPLMVCWTTPPAGVCTTTTNRQRNSNHTKFAAGNSHDKLRRWRNNEVTSSLQIMWGAASFRKSKIKSYTRTRT